MKNKKLNSKQLDKCKVEYCDIKRRKGLSKPGHSVCVGDPIKRSSIMELLENDGEVII